MAAGYAAAASSTSLPVRWTARPGRSSRPLDRRASRTILNVMETTTLVYGAQSMTDPLLEVLVSRPGEAFGRAFDDPAHGFLHPVDLDVARREHDAFTELLASLRPTVHELGVESDSPEL